MFGAASLQQLMVLYAGATAGTLRSGDFVPLTEEAGPLICPQSLTTNEGIGHCVGIKPIGSAYTSAT
eukprot:SAG31_NODE_22834_length_517_cov_0.691388_1_plen_66_part_10